MIVKQRSLFYFVNGVPFKSLEEAQRADLLETLPLQWEDGTTAPRERIADWLLKNSDQITDILTTTPTSRLKSRKLHGGTRKPRKAKVAPEIPLP